MPLDPKLTKFSTTSPLLASFDYIDLADGTGTRIFYGYSTRSSAGGDYHLSRQQVFASDVAAEDNRSATTFTNMLDLDYDLSEFNFPQTIKGTATITCCFNGAASSPDTKIRVIVKVRKWDGSNETEIASVQSIDYTDPLVKVITMNITIPRTNFKKGETLRLTMEHWGQRDGGGTVYLSAGQDPQNRDWNSGSGFTDITPSSDDPPSITQLVFHCPFEITS